MITLDLFKSMHALLSQTINRVMRFRFSLGATLLLAASAQAKTPIEVSACDLVKDSAKYNQQLVRVRGKISIGFENFSLQTGDCGKDLTGLWLAYGGDEPTPIISTANDRERRPGSVLKIDGIPVPLTRNADLELFTRRTAAARLAGPDNLCQYSECRLYEVSATLTGIFFATSPDSPLSGYGHLACCHLIAIEKISQVEARRTSVPAGGRFACTTDTWEMDAAQARHFAEFQSDSGDRLVAMREQVKPIAAHWGDSIPESGPSGFLREDPPGWQSADLLKTYFVQLNYGDEQQSTGDLKGATAFRKACHAVVAPYSLKTPIGCRDFVSEFSIDATEAKRLRKLAAEGGPESWRIGTPEQAAQKALEEAAGRWGVAPSPELKLQECSKPEMLGDDQLSACTWIDPDSMQTFSVGLIRPGYLRQSKWDESPWIMSFSNATVCTAERK